MLFSICVIHKIKDLSIRLYCISNKEEILRI